MTHLSFDHRLLVRLTTVLLVGVLAGPASADTLTFQEGVNGYAGTVDTSLFQDNADTPISVSKGLFIQNGEKDGQPNQRQVLIRFDDLFGDAADQVPVGSTIDRATLTLVCEYGFSPNGGLQVFELVEPFDAGTTWNRFGGGVAVGEQTASEPVAGFTLFNNKNDGSTADVTASVAAWAADPSTNLGWAIFEGDHVGFAGTSAAFASESDDPDKRPKLVIEFTPPADESSEPQ